MLEDNFKHKGLRKSMIKAVAQKGVAGKTVLDAMERVPRHFFIPDNTTFDVIAYEDKPFQIGAGQTISQPSTVAWQTELLKLQKGMKVLEIGTGSGYQAAILLELGVKVFSIERQRSLYDTTSALFRKLNYTAKLFYGDGYKGQPSYAPFDRIIVTAAAPEIPADLVAQLKVGGIMVIPVGESFPQVMTIINKLSETEHSVEELDECSFVPMLHRIVR